MIIINESKECQKEPDIVLFGLVRFLLMKLKRNFRFPQTGRWQFVHKKRQRNGEQEALIRGHAQMFGMTFGQLAWAPTTALIQCTSTPFDLPGTEIADVSAFAQKMSEMRDKNSMNFNCCLKIIIIKKSFTVSLIYKLDDLGSSFIKGAS